MKLFSFSFYKVSEMSTWRKILYVQVRLRVVQVLQNCTRVQLEYKYQVLHHSVARQCNTVVRATQQVNGKWQFWGCQNSVTCKRNSRLFNLGEIWVVSTNIMQFNEFEYHFSCRRKVVHLCFIMSPGKMIFAVLDLWLSPLQWVLTDKFLTFILVKYV